MDNQENLYQHYYIDKYQVEKLLGQGSYGTVYQCVSESGYSFAIKLLNKKRVNQLLNSEINAMKSISNPHVVRLYELIYHEGYPCLVMDLCNSGTLLDYIYRQPNHRLNEEQAMKIFVQILDGFKSINQAGLIHRDMKLENILIHDGVPKISDFGLAIRVHENELTALCCGTPAYMAPEVLKNEVYNYEVDIWSLGIILFAMLYFEWPFSSSSLKKQLEKIEKLCQPEFILEKVIKKQPIVTSASQQQASSSQQHAKYQSLLHCSSQSPDKMDKSRLQSTVNKSPFAQQSQLMVLQPATSVSKSPDKVSQNTQQHQLQKEIQKQQSKSPDQGPSPELQDFFKRIFVVDPSKRMNFLELFKHPLILKYESNCAEYVSFYQSSLNSLSLLRSEVFFKQKQDQKQNEQDQQQSQQQQNLTIHKKFNNAYVIKSHQTQFQSYFQPIQQIFNTYNFILDAYEMIKSEAIFDAEFDTGEVFLLKYFLVKQALFYALSLQRIFENRQMYFASLQNWEEFVDCQDFKDAEQRVRKDIDTWSPRYLMLFKASSQTDIIQQQIKDVIVETIDIEEGVDLKTGKIPDQFKLPYRGVLVTIFSKMISIAKNYFSLNSSGTSSSNYVNQLNTKAGLRRLKLALRILLCAIANRIFLMNAEGMHIEGLQNFKYQNQQNYSILNFFEWLNEIDTKEVELTIEAVLNKYFPGLKMEEMKFL